MAKDIRKRKNVSKEEKYNLINRFNKPLDEGPFLELFQKIMIERLLLNKEKQYHPENVKQIINSTKIKGYNHKYRRNAKSLNTDISGGFILSTNVEAEFYILLQEVVKDVTGNYMPMDEFIHILLTWFYQYYNKDSKRKINLPFMKKPKNNKNNSVSLFNKQFSCFYKNISLT